MKLKTISNIYFVLFALLAMSMSTQINAQEKSVVYVGGDGVPAVTLVQKHSLENLRPFSTLQIGGENIAVDQELSAGGGVFYRSADGQILLRLSLSGGATFYPEKDSKGVPVQIRTLGFVDELEQPSTLDEWSKIYTYSGSAKKPEKLPSEPSN